MDQELLAWLKSKRDYAQGVKVYHRLGTDEQLKQQFVQSNAARHGERLFAELRAIYHQLKGIAPKGIIEASQVINTPSQGITEPATPKNPELEAACKAEADKLYKVLSHARARLFAQCTIHPQVQENAAEAVANRSDLALYIAEIHPEVDRLYDRYRFVVAHGRLPDEPAHAAEEEIPRNPILLERKRINTLKSINKLKLKPQTPERVAYLQELESLLKSLTDAVDQFIEDFDRA